MIVPAIPSIAFEIVKGCSLNGVSGDGASIMRNFGQDRNVVDDDEPEESSPGSRQRFFVGWLSIGI